MLYNPTERNMLTIIRSKRAAWEWHSALNFFVRQISMFRLCYKRALDLKLEYGNYEGDTPFEFDLWLEEELIEHGDGKSFALYLTTWETALEVAERRFLRDYINSPNKEWKPSHAVPDEDTTKVYMNLFIETDFEYLTQWEGYSKSEAYEELSKKYIQDESSIKRILKKMQI